MPTVMRRIAEFLTILFGLLGIGGGLFFVFTLISIVPVWFLWNWLMPVFGLPELTILQSAALTVLARLLAGGRINLQGSSFQ